MRVSAGPQGKATQTAADTIGSGRPVCSAAGPAQRPLLGEGARALPVNLGRREPGAGGAARRPELRLVQVRCKANTSKNPGRAAGDAGLKRPAVAPRFAATASTSAWRFGATPAWRCRGARRSAACCRRANTCSTAARTADLRALARRVRSAIGRPFGFLRWMRETRPRPARSASFFAERYAVSPQTLLAVLSGSSRSPSRALSCAAASVAVQRRIRPWRRSIETWFL
jgi:hypothetical protein